jgi:hypothetical protein
MQDLILLTTTRYGERLQELKRLIESVGRSRAELPDVKVSHYILVQGASEKTANFLQTASNPMLQISYTAELVSLSRARNMMLEQIAETNRLDHAVVGFPDDDAWYPRLTLAGIMQRFLEDELLDLWFCKCGPHPVWLGDLPGARPTLQDLYSNATSNSMFVRGCLAKRVGRFDESLGLGTDAMSGEDSDFAMRTFQLGRTSLFCDAQLVGHRDHGSRDRELYFGGALMVIARYTSAGSGAYLVLARKCIIGAVLVFTGRIQTQQLITAFKRAFSASNLRIGRKLERAGQELIRGE